jgi:hypothetical protein
VRAGHPFQVALQSMSKFRDTPPSAPDDKGIAFPAGGEMTLEQREAELDAFNKAAGDELMLRLKYSMLRRTLDSIEKFDPVPDDWRARLEARDPLDLAAFDDNGEEDEEDGDQEA